MEGGEMAFRFRKSIRIAKGVRVNFGKKGMSLSAGVRGASINIGSRGTYANVGIPGTGISYRRKVSGSSNKVAQRRQSAYQRELASRQRQEALSQVTLKINDDGSLEVQDKFGIPLSGKNLKLMWEQKEKDILQWLSDQKDNLNEDNQLIASIHEDTPSPDQIPEYEDPVFELQEPHPPTVAKVNLLLRILPGIGGWFLKSRQAKLDRDYLRSLEANYPGYQLSSDTSANVFTEVSQYWKQEKESHSQRIELERNIFQEKLHNDVNFMEELLESSVDELDWPRETLVNYDIQNDGQLVFMDVDLPEIEDLPDKRYEFTSTGKRLRVKSKSQKQLREEYATHIHGIALRLAGTVFATLPVVSRIVISGYSQRLDSASGHTNDEYLFSVKVPRDQFAKINFDNLEALDPIAALESFEIERRMTKTGIFKAIQPFGLEAAVNA